MSRTPPVNTGKPCRHQALSIISIDEPAIRSENPGLFQASRHCGP
ncbi:hypothetical protein ASZ90_010267 [hydrocarbon metagenome]|uniref:Uncharacterized protein n=1 Tax=hydrocarbon metagenome TaxID=938273 RepID=A0A0W8FH00_9ZZZZ